MDVKDKLGWIGRTIGWEIWVSIIAVAIVLGSIAIQYSSAKVATGILSIGQGLVYTYVGIPGFRSDIVFAVFGVIVTTFAALFSRLMHYIHRRSQVKPTLETLTMEDLNKATNTAIENVNKATDKIEDAIGRMEKKDTERWDALVASHDLNTQKIDSLEKTLVTRLTSIDNQLAGKGLLEKAKEAVVSKLPGKSEEA